MTQSEYDRKDLQLNAVSPAELFAQLGTRDMVRALETELIKSFQELETVRNQSDFGPVRTRYDEEMSRLLLLRKALNQYSLDSFQAHHPLVVPIIRSTSIN